MMKKVTITLVGIMLIFTPLITFSESIKAESGKTWYVPDDFSTIQAAIDNSSVKSGDTIYVKGGTYYGGLYVTKALTIVGENKDNTIIDLKKTDAVYISADNVTIKDFTMRNAESHWFIYVEGTGNNTITNNIINGNMTTGVGIILLECKYGHNVITDNTITGCNGSILLLATSNNTITGNTCGSISLSLSHNNLIEGNNIVSSTVVFGIRLDWSYFNSVKGNTITYCEGGIQLFKSNKNSIQGNIITGKKMTADNIKNDDFGVYGIRLVASGDNTIGGTDTSLKNTISHMETGICFEDSYSRTTLRKDNLVRGNLINIAGSRILKITNRLLNNQFIMQFLLNHPNAFPVLRNIYFSLP
jgi:parallel beta-helix repeat protein